MDRTGRTTLFVTSVFAIPMAAVVAYLAVQLRDSAMRPERAPIRTTLLCVTTDISESPELTVESQVGPRPQLRASLSNVCGGENTVFTPPKRTTSLVLRELDYPDWYLYSTATHTVSALVPDASAWPFTDPDTIGYHRVQEGFQVLPSLETPSRLKEFNPTMYQAIADVQRALNQQILLLAGGAVILVALVATGTRLVLRRAFRPAEVVAAPPTGMGSILSRISEASSDLVLLARMDPESPDSVDLAVIAHRETAHRYPPDLTYVVDLGDDPVPVRGNPELLQLLLTDVLDNAERQANSTITLRLRTTPQFAVLEAIVDGSTPGSHHYSTEILPLR